jgi:PhzF family phenazine biosynthesis protein
MQKIYLVDTFSSHPYTGNPAPVVISESFPDDMQKIAAELNFPSTAFVTMSQNDRFNIRWFSPKVELALCGHALLAAAHILYQEKLITGEKILFNSLTGPLEVTKDQDQIILGFPLQTVSKRNDKSIFQKLFAVVDIHEVYQAQDDVIVVLDFEKDLQELTLDFSAIKKIDATAIIVTAPSQPHDFVSRVFAPRVGINEDPVTGSSHCKLADYWSKRLEKNILRAYQASERGGYIDIEIKNDRVFLKGSAITIMQGFWNIK